MVTYSRAVDELGPGASDEMLTRYAERNSLANLPSDVKDFGEVDAGVPILVAPQGITGGGVRSAVGRLESISFDPAETGPIWLSAL